MIRYTSAVRTGGSLGHRSPRWGLAGSGMNGAGDSLGRLASVTQIPTLLLGCNRLDLNLRPTLCSKSGSMRRIAHCVPSAPTTKSFRQQKTWAWAALGNETYST